MASRGTTFRDTVLPSDPVSVRVLVDSTGFFYPDEIDIAVELVQERLDRGETSDYHFVFATGPGGEVLGYTCYGPIAGTAESYDLYWIAVRGTERGGGIGKGLLAESEERIRRVGGRRVYIETSSRDLYRPTHAFYERRGYRLEATLEDFYRPGDSKLIYVKVLSASPAAP
jgi:GNAT superfamily N-acetyltransferase